MGPLANISLHATGLAAPRLAWLAKWGQVFNFDVSLSPIEPSASR